MRASSVRLLRAARQFSACLAWGLALGGPAAAQTFKVGFFDAPPHVTQDKAGAPTGPAVELFKAVSQRMGIKDVSYQELPLSRALASLESGDIDAVLFLSKSPEREAKFFYPAKPYYLSKPSLAVDKKSTLTEVKSPDDLKALKIGTFLGMNLSATMRQPGLTLDAMGGADAYYARNFQKLTMGRVDAVYSPDEMTLAREIKANNLEQTVRIVSLPDEPNKTFTAFHKKHADTLGPKYQAALDAVLKEKGDYPKAFMK